MNRETLKRLRVKYYHDRADGDNGDKFALNAPDSLAVAQGFYEMGMFHADCIADDMPFCEFLERLKAGEFKYYLYFKGCEIVWFQPKTRIVKRVEQGFSDEEFKMLMELPLKTIREGSSAQPC